MRRGEARRGEALDLLGAKSVMLAAYLLGDCLIDSTLWGDPRRGDSL